MIVAVFDFDDTLYASSYLKTETEKKSQELADSILLLMETAKKYCNKIYIITNATKAWIKLCTTEYLPGCELLCDKVDVISTQDSWYSKGEEKFETWKIKAFDDVLKPLFQNQEQKHTLLSFGDAMHDRAASASLRNEHITVKNIKFVEAPTLDQLLYQQKIICHVFDHIYNFEGDLDLMMTVSTKINLGEE